MSAEAITIRLDNTLLAALQEAAARRHLTVDEMAGEAIAEGLRTERLNRLRELLAKGHRHAAASGIPEDSVAEMIQADREQRKSR